MVTPHKHREFTKCKIILLGVMFVVLLPIMIFLVFFDCFLDCFAKVYNLCPDCRVRLD